MHNEEKSAVAEVKVKIGSEFTKRFSWTRQIMTTIHPSTFGEGLLHELEKVASEDKRRAIADDAYSLQRHCIIRAKK